MADDATIPTPLVSLPDRRPLLNHSILFVTVLLTQRGSTSDEKSKKGVGLGGSFCIDDMHDSKYMAGTTSPKSVPLGISSPNARSISPLWAEALIL
mmetsp:Transcript_34864/g.84239  ORF Transcript_34864/g.84239 Transcript_34864/m.84239 type:complete len:96 (-) Transcript_34864:1790-2077(-)